ncbi:hypothetical protein ADMFC3_27980 [Geovibrio sp. ADMFC3]|nr:hypothetical protein [Deferribacteraceae bacterium]
MEFENIHFWIAIIASGVYVLTQLIPMLLGYGIDVDGLDADIEDTESSSIFEFISFKNLVVFMMGYGWSSYALIKIVPDIMGAVIVILSIFVGIVLIFINMLPMKALLKLQQKNEFHNKDIVGLSGIVTVSTSKNAIGKVKITVGDIIREYFALSNGEDLAVNTPITITKVLEDGVTVLIKRERRD